MLQIFLSYAREDGKEASARLRSQLERAGYQVWRDIEEMQGGQAWKAQLRNAVGTVDAVLVLLTPASVKSKNVEWEWKGALFLEKRVIPLLILPCEVPEELNALHYHNLTTVEEYILGFAALMRDLNLLAEKKAAVMPTHTSVSSDAGQAQTRDRNVAISGDVRNSSITTGDGNIVGSSNTVNSQISSKYNINVEKADHLRIGDDYRG
jgi:hypothetical protein